MTHRAFRIAETEHPQPLDGLLDALKFGASERPRLVHRLDRDTSGVFLLARNAGAAAIANPPRPIVSTMALSPMSGLASASV